MREPPFNNNQGERRVQTKETCVTGCIHCVAKEGSALSSLIFALCAQGLIKSIKCSQQQWCGGGSGLSLSPTSGTVASIFRPFCLDPLPKCAIQTKLCNRRKRYLTKAPPSLIFFCKLSKHKFSL